MALHSPCGIFDISSPWQDHVFADCHSRLRVTGRVAGEPETALRHKVAPSFNDFKLSAQAWGVALAGIFFPVLAEASMRRLLVRVGPQFFDIEVDTQSRARRQFDPAILHRQR